LSLEEKKQPGSKKIKKAFPKKEGGFKKEEKESHERYWMVQGFVFQKTQNKGRQERKCTIGGERRTRRDGTTIWKEGD